MDSLGTSKQSFSLLVCSALHDQMGQRYLDFYDHDAYLSPWQFITEF